MLSQVNRSHIFGVREDEIFFHGKAMATMSNTQHNAAKVKYGIRHLGLAAFGCKSHKEQSMAKANMMYDRIIITSKRIYLEVRLRELSGAYFSEGWSTLSAAALPYMRVPRP